jgi:general stress protein 26
MEVSSFEEIQTEFMRRVSQAVYCNMASVDRKGRPRSRMLHPIWDGPIGWCISWQETLKTKHLLSNPYVSLAYIQDRDKPVYAECRAAWVDEESEKLRIWELHKRIPPPLGFDPEPNYGTIHHRYYGLLKFTPWMIQLGNLGGEAIVWRSES